MSNLALLDAGAHSVGYNNADQLATLTPKIDVQGMHTFTVSGGSASSPQVQNAVSGLISVGTELWFRKSGQSTLVKAVVGGVSESGGTTNTPTNTNGVHAASNSGQHQIAYNKTIPAGSTVSALSAKNSVAGTIRACIYRQDTTTTFTIVAFTTITHTGDSTWISASLTTPYTIPNDGHAYHPGVYSPSIQMHFGDATDITNWGMKATTYSGQSDASVGLQVTTVHEYQSTYTAMVTYTTITACTYTLSSLSPALTGDIGDWTAAYKVRNAQYNFGVTSYSAGSLVLTQASSGALTTGDTVRVDGVDEVLGTVVQSGSGPYTYTCTVTLSGTPATVSKYKPMMYLATGQTDEPLVKESALTLAGSGTTASQVVVTSASSLLPFFASGNLSRDLILTVGGADSTVSPNGTVTEVENTGLVGLISPMTANSSAGQVASATNETYPAWRAFDGGLSGQWAAIIGSNQSLQIDLGSQKTFTAYSLQDGNGPYTPSAWTFYGSNDGTNWTQIDSRSGITWTAGEKKTWTVSSQTWRYLKWTFTATGAAYYYIGEAQVYISGTTGYTTTIPIPAQSGVPTAAKLRSRFQTPVDIASATYNATGPKIELMGATISLPNNPLIKRAALKLRGDYNASTFPIVASDARIMIEEY